MIANKKFYMDIEELGLSQIFLNKDKINSVSSWFDPIKITDYEPLPVYDFLENGKYTLTDGHTRAYVYYKNGVKYIPVIEDKDEIVTCDIGIRLYKEYIEWCNRFHIKNIKDLGWRILPLVEYEFLWIERCDRLYNLFRAIDEKIISAKEYEDLKRIGNSKLSLYGANNDLSRYFYEDFAENKWSYDGQLRREIV